MRLQPAWLLLDGRKSRSTRECPVFMCCRIGFSVQLSVISVCVVVAMKKAVVSTDRWDFVCYSPLARGLF